MSKKSIITSIGSAVYDLMYYTNEGVVVKTKDVTKREVLGFEFGAKLGSKEVYSSWGGSALNTATTFKEMGLKPGVVSCIGDDAVGRELIRELRARKIPTNLIQVDKKNGTSLSFIVNNKKKKDHVIFFYPGAKINLKLTTSVVAKIRTPWIYLGSLGGSTWETNCRSLFAHVARKNTRLAWNPGGDEIKAGAKKLSKYLHLTEVLIVNLDEAVELLVNAGEKVKDLNPRVVIKQLHEYGQKITVITNGGKGAYVHDGKKLLYKSALKKKKIVNTTGAGDAFGSGFVAGLHMYRDNLSRALSLAIHNSGSVVGVNGAQQGILTKAKLKKLNI